MRKMQKHFRDQVRSSCRCRRYPILRTTAGIGSPEVPDPRYAGYCVGTFGQPKMGLPLAERRIQLPGARFVGQPLVGIHCLFSWSLRNATAPGLHKAPSVYGCGPDIGPLAASISRPDGGRCFVLLARIERAISGHSGKRCSAYSVIFARPPASRPPGPF